MNCCKANVAQLVEHKAFKLRVGCSSASDGIKISLCITLPYKGTLASFHLFYLRLHRLYCLCHAELAHIRGDTNCLLSYQTMLLLSSAIALNSSESF